MLRLKNSNVFLTICCCSIFLVLGMVFVSFDSMLKGTSAAFGNITGSLTLPSDIKYYSNYPDDLEDLVTTDTGRKEYLLLDNMFEVPLGYVFVGWNTKEDGTGDSFKYNDQIYVTAILDFYAQWAIIEEDEDDNEIVIAYGDVNLNEVIDEDDYILVEKYVNGSIVLDENMLRNADVNQDGNVDLVDTDIIKQAFLETDGYVGYFPGNPILKYEIYEKKEDISNDDIVNNNPENNGGNNNSGNSNQGNNNSSGVGSNNTGSKPSGGNASSSNGNTSNSGSNNANKDGEVNDNTNVDDNIDDEKNIYEFRYLVDDTVFSMTSCNNIVDGKCDLILPKGEPLKNGYIFLGWSEKSDCSTDILVVNSILVDNDRSYYACFIEDNNKVDNNNNINIWIIVISIWIAAITLIYYIISYYKKRNKLEN